MPPMLPAATASHPPETPTACFSVHAKAEPGVMPRVLALFAKRGLVPTSWHSRVNGGELTIDLQMTGLDGDTRSEEHTSELQSHVNLVCRLLLEKKKTKTRPHT